MNKQIGIIAGVMVLLLLGTAAWAQGGQGRRGGQGGDGQGRDGQDQQRQRPAIGSIISISAEQIVIKPELPPEMAERRQEKGRDMPKLPEQITLKLSADTKFAFDGGMGSISDFKAGDFVLVKQDGEGNALVVSDRASAKQFMEGRQERRGEGGPGGQGGPGGERRPPAMGSITAISADSITIKPMIPEEMRKRMEENGRPLPELPASITWSIDSETRFMKNGEKSDSNPFKLGDIVVVMGPPDDGSARAILDEATARQKMEERGGPGGPGGPGKGKGKRQPK